jgi:trigger factor
MKKTKENLDDCQVVFTIEAEPDEVAEVLEATYQDLVKRLDVPGFRRGKAPRPVLENYFGRKMFREEAQNSLVSQLCRQVIDEEDIKAIVQPEIEILQTEPPLFKATFSLPAVVELGDYHNIKIELPSSEVAEEEIEAVIERIRHQYSFWQPAERAVNFGDLVSFEVSGDGLENKNDQIEVIEGSTNPLPGFVEQLVGMSQGEEKEFSLSYPDDYTQEELAGKQYQYRIKVTEIKEKKMPELNDEFVQGLGEGLTSLAELRGRIAANLKIDQKRRARVELEQKAIEEVVKISQVNFPPILLEGELNYLLDEQAGMFGQSVANYFRIFGKTEEEVREALRPRAKERLIHNLILDKIAEEENLEVTEEEIDGEIERLLQTAWGENKDELTKFFNHPAGRDRIRRDLLRERKAINYLVEIVQANSEGMSSLSEGETVEKEVKDDS